MAELPWYKRRKQVNVYVSPRSYEALKDYARTNDVTVAAVVEAIGACLHEGTAPNLGTRRFVQKAREIAKQRRAR